MSTHPPADLGEKARQLWDNITSEYELRADERRLLEDACREVDIIERLEAEMRLSPVLDMGSQGQPVISPILPELRQHRAILRALLAQLKLNDVPGADAAETYDPRSEAARHAARQRWHRGA